MTEIYLTIFFFILSFKKADSAGCTGSSTIVGVRVDVNTVKSSFEANVANTGFLIPIPDFTVTCCGVVQTIETYFDNAGTTYFQLWRPVGGDNYRLVGNINVTKSTFSAVVVIYNIPVAEQITAQIGDVIGWWSSSTNLVRHRNGTSENNGNLLRLITPQPVTGTIANWSTSAATKADGRTYAVQYILGANLSPSFTNFGSTVNIFNSNATGSIVHTVSVTDSEASDIATLIVTRTDINFFFEFNSINRTISIASVLSGAVGNHLLNFTVSDTCGNTATGTLTIHVANMPPTIHNLQNSTSISEGITTAKLLYTLSVTDPTDQVLCILSNSSVPFNVRQVSGTTNYGIYTNYNPGFNYDTCNSYSLTIVCNDGTDNVTGNYTVYLLRNKAPNITNLEASVSVSTTATTGTVVYIVSATDPESDQLYYNFTCNSSCPFTLFQSGVVQLNQDLSGQTTVAYDLYIYVFDGKSLVGPRTLTIDITDINSAVNIVNLPLGSALSVPENTVLGKAIYQISISDPDVGNNHTYSMTSLSGTGMSYFAINSSSGLVSTSGTVLNFETLNSTSFNFSVTVSDGWSSNTKILSIDVTNVNEAPTFNQALYTISANEASSGTALPDPVYGVTDVDTGETKSYSNDCGNYTGLFNMAPATGLLTFASDYDYDLGTLPTSLLCTVTVTDSGGLTATTSLSIKLNNINDNIPIFVPASYTFFVTYGSATGTTIGTVTATDGDLGTYGTLSYSLDQSSLNTTYFGVTSLTGQLYISSSINSIGIDGSVTFLAVVTDGGGLSTNASVIVKVATTTTVTTTTTETRYKSFIEDGRNIAWLTLSALTIAVIVVVVLWLACDISKHGFPKLKIECCKARARQIMRKRPLPCKKPPVIQFPPQPPPVIPSPPPSPPVEHPPVQPHPPLSPPYVDEPERPSTSFAFWRDKDFGMNLLK
ncbi:hypothetical protein CHS0354_021098 [Potamilus streckersoni]|uniref:Cadherin domain-containing protein n=1 Tax=Potamilus streckersoni TaxID=2493646 RepID=A0AAE0VT84_9BIVA|nr:hypothetical protein CHS0354_021098 [Potamilus streckersoni]